jgi:acetylglutamate kinase
MRRKPLSREQRDETIRTYVEGYIARHGMLPKVREVIRAVGGSATPVTAVLREYRIPHASRNEERQPNPSPSR